MKNTLKLILIFIALNSVYSCYQVEKQELKIDRFALVNRHNVYVKKIDSLASLSVGNGSFAFTVDATGLQTFPDSYKNGVCLGTMSEWGWHSFPNHHDFRFEESYQYFDVEDREIPYAVNWKKGERKDDAANYFRKNPHRLHLGLIGFELKKQNGEIALSSEISAIDQHLNLWDGMINSSFKLEEEHFKVNTCASPEKDLLAFRIQTKNGFKHGSGIKIRFPYPSGGHVDDAIDWKNADKHTSEIIEKSKNNVVFRHQLDTTEYFLSIRCNSEIEVIEKSTHYFILKPATTTTDLTLTAEFNASKSFQKQTSFSLVKDASAEMWKNYWESGGMVDFSGTADKRARELERRIILSQYLTRVNCAGNYPPQETGLTMNSWYGKFHLEMHWWHAAHWAYWNQASLLEKSLNYYSSVFEKAKAKAASQGYEGVRWQKMTDNFGFDSPSGVGEFLIWQQPHIIYFVEQLYKENQNKEMLYKYLPLITSTADFMADFARWDEKGKRYILGPPLIPAQESLEKEKTINPPFELAYWHWGLSKAQEMLQRLNMTPNHDWQTVIDQLSELPQFEGKYLAAESAPDSYKHKEYYSDHPMVLGAFGILPQTLPLDTAVMETTFDYIEENWNWERTWGWDYPMAAMCATRLGKPEKAVDLLLKDVLKNSYLSNGHNYQGNRLRIYLPGNGGLLTAVAMMCAGYEGNTNNNPGFPEDWNVKWENLKPVF